MKLDKRVLVGGLVVIGGIFLLWLLNRMGAKTGVVAGDALPDQSQPAPGGDSTILPLPDVGDIAPRFQTAPPAARVTGGGCCNDESDCGGMGSYIQSVTPVMLPEAYLETAYANLQSAVVSYPMRSA